MKKLTWEAHQTSDDLTVANVAHTFGMFHFQEQLFAAEYNTKHVHNLLDMSDKVGEWSRWKYVGLREIEDVASKKLEIFWTLKIIEFYL